MTAGLKPYARLVQALRAAGYGGTIMAGGVHATLCPVESLVEGADFAVQGPGEVPLQMILAGAAPGSVPGLVWRRDGKVVANRVTPEQKLSLDALPHPIFRFDRDMMLVDGKLRRLTWRLHCKHSTWGGRYYDMVTSRGCVYRCSYCCNLEGAPVRRATVERVMAELRSVKEREPRVAGINFHDDSFFAGSDEWMASFCARMKAEIGLPFIARMIPRYVTRERMELLKSAGVDYVTMGLEASDRVNKEVFNRHETAQTYLRAAKIILDLKLYLSTDIILHNPYEREEDLRQMALTLNALPRPNWGVVSLPLTPFPGTPLHARCARDGMLGRFCTDAYDSMLVPSRAEGYRTPRFWMLLNTEVLTRIPPALGERLIAAGPSNAQAVQTVERLAVYLRRTKRITSWLHERIPWLYAAAGHLLKRAARGR
jgi:radical SAM superfamily enzyme YgiQ (UPF0313 family)